MSDDDLLQPNIVHLEGRINQLSNLLVIKEQYIKKFQEGQN